MIDRKKQIITQDFSESHKALDLRCVDKKSKIWKGVQSAVAPEKCKILRTSKSHGPDGYGNPFVVMEGLESGYIFKSIHTKPSLGIKPGKIVKAGRKIGKPVIAGNSHSLHEHFEVLEKDDYQSYIDPKIYFYERNIPCEVAK